MKELFFIDEARTLLIFPGEYFPVTRGATMQWDPKYRNHIHNLTTSDYSARNALREDEDGDAPHAHYALVCWANNGDKGFVFHVQPTLWALPSEKYRDSNSFRDLKTMFPGITIRGEHLIFDELSDMLIFKIMFSEQLG